MPQILSYYFWLCLKVLVEKLSHATEFLCVARVGLVAKGAILLHSFRVFYVSLSHCPWY